MGGALSRAPSGDTAEALVASHLDALAVALHRRLGEVAGVAVTMVSTAGEPCTVGASTALARQVDAVQFRIGSGPCLDALHGRGGAHVVDLAGDPRWPSYGRAARELGVRCCVSVPVVAHEEVVAVLKVYADQVDGLGEDQRETAAATADEVASSVALARTLTAYAREVDDRTATMNTRRTIDLALGVVMERAGVGPDEAYTLLRRQSQHENVPLADAAQALVAGFGVPAGTAAPFERR